MAKGLCDHSSKKNVLPPKIHQWHRIILDPKKYCAVRYDSWRTRFQSLFILEFVRTPVLVQWPFSAVQRYRTGTTNNYKDMYFLFNSQERDLFVARCWFDCLCCCLLQLSLKGLKLVVGLKKWSQHQKNKKITYMRKYPKIRILIQPSV